MTTQFENYTVFDDDDDDPVLIDPAGAAVDTWRENYPYDHRMSRDEYEEQKRLLQIELLKLQKWSQRNDHRHVIVFEGRDAAGKGGTIKRFMEHLNPRGARVVALEKPTEKERTQWYFQRYVNHLPAAGELVLFDRSWYNRGIVEHVMGWVEPAARARWFDQVGPFEKMLADDGIDLVKYWINVGRATQLERFLDREKDPLKQWKLSQIDIDGLPKWQEYTDAIRETLTRTHAPLPWTVLRGDDKKRTRINAIRALLHQLDYERKDSKAIGALDPRIIGGPEIVTKADKDH